MEGAGGVTLYRNLELQHINLTFPQALRKDFQGGKPYGYVRRFKEMRKCRILEKQAEALVTGTQEVTKDLVTRSDLNDGLSTLRDELKDEMRAMKDDLFKLYWAGHVVSIGVILSVVKFF